jgi:hypothetical protein
MSRNKLSFPIDISDSIYQIKFNPKNELFTLLRNGEPILTPGGFDVEHKDERFLIHMQTELESEDELNPVNLSLYSIYSTCKEFFELKSRIFSIDDVRQMLLTDVVLRSVAGPEKAYQFEKWKPLLNFLSEKKLKYPDLIQTMDSEDMETWINSMGPDCQGIMQELTEVMCKEINYLSAAQKAVIINSVSVNNSFMYGYLIATGKCTELEYASGVLAGHCSLPGIFGDFSRSDFKEALISIMRDAQIFSTFVLFSPIIKESSSESQEH